MACHWRKTSKSFWRLACFEKQKSSLGGLLYYWPPVDQASLCPHSFVVNVPASSIKEQCIFLHPMSLLWLCNSLWSTEYGKSDVHILEPDLKESWGFAISLLEPLCAVKKLTKLSSLLRGHEGRNWRTQAISTPTSWQANEAFGPSGNSCTINMTATVVLGETSRKTYRIMRNNKALLF